MSVSKKQHSQPIYLVSFDNHTLTTNTENGRGLVAEGGYPVQYRQTINATTGACTCGCPGFQDSIAPRAQRNGITPTLANEKMCIHIRASAEFGVRHGYIAADLAKPTACPVAANSVTQEAPAAAVDYFSYFESLT